MNVQKTTTCTDNAVLAGDILVARVRGVNLLTNLAVATLSFLGLVLEKAPEFVGLLTKSFMQLSVWTGIIHQFTRIKEWVDVKNGGSDITRKVNPQSAVTTAALTANGVFLTAQGLHYVALIALGTLLNTVNILTRVTSLAYYALDFWDNTSNLTLIQESSDKTSRCLNRWKLCKAELAKGNNETAQLAQLGAFARKELSAAEADATRRPDNDSGYVALEKAHQSRINIWRALGETKISLARVEDYIEKKIVKFEAKMANESLAHKKSWLGIALDITAFAAISLAFALSMAVATPTIVFTMTILGIGATVSDLVRYFVQSFFTPHAIAPTPLPNFKPQLTSI